MEELTPEKTHPAIQVLECLSIQKKLWFEILKNNCFQVY
jgi:hypothetical protein